MAYHFQNNPKKLADPFVDGNILIKERLENCDADYAVSYAETFSNENEPENHDAESANLTQI